MIMKDHECESAGVQAFFHALATMAQKHSHHKIVLLSDF